MGILDILEQRGYKKEAVFLKATEKESIQMLTTQSTDEAFAPSESRIGGIPHLPENIAWPVFRGKPLGFLAQINLAEVTKYDTEHLLPTSGILYFFHEGGDEIWGFDPKDKGGFQVIYSKETDNLTLTPRPEELEEHLHFSPCKLSFARIKSYPTDYYMLDQELFAGEEADEERNDGFFDILSEEVIEGTINKLFGHPDLIQGDIFMESQLVTNGFYCGDSSGYEDPGAQQLKAGAKDWLLLFQIDSDDNADMLWGDVGRIYFTIKKEDLANCNFAAAWSIFQCS